MKRWRNITPIQDGIIKESSNNYDISPVLKEYDDEIESIIGRAQHKVNAAGNIQRAIAGPTASKPKSNGKTTSSSDWAKQNPVFEQPILKYVTPSVDDESDDEEYGEQTTENGRMLLSEAEPMSIRALNGLKRQFGLLQSQCVEFRNRLKTSSESLSKTQERNSFLEFQLTDIAKDLEIIKQQQKQVQTGQTRVSAVVKNNSEEANARLKSDQMRKALLNEENIEVKISMEELLEKGILVWAYDILTGAWQQLIPFKEEIKQIEAKFGSSIMSYFLFKRFIFLQFVVVDIVVIIYAVLHLQTLVAAGKTTGILSGDGIMPAFMFASSYSISENTDYASLVLIVVFLFLITIIDKMVREDKYSREAAAIESENAYPYSTEVLCSWDFSQTAKSQTHATSGALAQTYAMMLDKSIHEARIRNRNRNQVFVLWMSRSIIMLVYIALQLVAIVVFLYFSFYADKIIQRTSNSILKPVSTYIQSFTFQAIGSLMPMVADVATDLEAWDSGHVLLMVSIIRNYASNTVNSIVVGISYFLLADPFLFATTPRVRDITMSVSSRFKCRFDQTGNAIFALVLTTYGSNLISFVTTPLIKYMKFYLLGKTASYIPPQFNVANNIVTTLLFIGIIFLLIPFAPLSLLLAPLYLYVEMKWQCYIALEYYRKPKKAWKSYQAMPVFSIFYFINFILLLLIPSFYFLSSKTFPKDCSLQDDYVNLCSNSVTSQNTCDPDRTSPYYTSYGSTLYPASICESSCGPFVFDSSNFFSVKESIVGVEVLYYIWTILFSWSYFPWALCALLCIVIATSKNSNHIAKAAAQAKMKVYESHIHGLEAERAVNAKKLMKLQAIDKDL